ncbi:MAG TPA: response regulator [Pirellulales bacterium]
MDDEPDTCANLADIFGDLGYRVDVAYDGPTAIQLVEKNHYGVALLDLKMPGMSGLELYRHIRRVSAGTVAIIVTAYAGGETAQAVLEAGAWKIVSKPVDFPQLMKLVGDALDRPLVLVVDDDHDLCDALWDLFQEYGYRVCLAHDGSEAAKLIVDQSFDVALIDMVLPAGSGAEVLQRIRQQNPDTRAILITGYRSQMEERIHEALREGADAVCYKPFDLPGLLKTVEELAR